MHSEAAEILANALEQDALAHEAGRMDELGMQYDPVLAQILPIDDIPPLISTLAFNFWCPHYGAGTCSNNFHWDAYHCRCWHA